MDKSSLTTLAPQQLTHVRNASSGPSSQTVYGGQEHAPHHTGPADRRSDRPSGEAAEHAPEVGTEGAKAKLEEARAKVSLT
jgi:hypothetical protein